MQIFLKCIHARVYLYIQNNYTHVLCKHKLLFLNNYTHVLCKHKLLFLDVINRFTALILSHAIYMFTRHRRRRRNI